MKLLHSLLAAACFALPVAATAAPVLIFETDGSAFVDVPLGDGSFGDFFDDGLDDLDISVTGQIAGPFVLSDLLISDLTGTLLESSTVIDAFATLVDPDAAGPTEDSATFVFGNLSGSAAAQFGDTATVLFTFFAEDAVGGFLETVTAQVFAEPAPIPLPATLPLLSFALLGGFAVARRRKG